MSRTRGTAAALCALVGLPLAGSVVRGGESPPPPVAPRPPAQDALPAGLGVEERLAEISRRVQNALVYPDLARTRGLSGETLVRFEIASDGRPRDVRVAATSGSAALDRAARRAVADAAPLPWVYGVVRVPVHFELHDAKRD